MPNSPNNKANHHKPNKQGNKSNLSKGWKRKTHETEFPALRRIFTIKNPHAIIKPIPTKGVARANISAASAAPSNPSGKVIMAIRMAQSSRNLLSHLW